MIQLNGGQALVRALGAEGITLACGVTGGKLTPLMQALGQSAQTRYIGARHEGAAAMMAAGFAAATGRCALALGECGSGAGNMVPGLAIATQGSLPLIAITSNNQHYASYPARALFAPMDTRALFAPVTKWGTTVHDGRRIPQLVHQALREALGGRPGAVHLDVPQDILRGLIDYDEREFPAHAAHYRALSPPQAAAADIAAAARLLARASRPLLLAGGGVVAAEASATFRRLVARLGAPATATQSGLGSIDSADPHFIGHGAVYSSKAVARACREADVVLAVGCRFSSWLWDDRGPLLGPATQLIQIDIDAARLGAVAPLALGIQADAGSALSALLDALAEHVPGRAVADWLGTLRARHASDRAALAAVAADTGTPMHPAALAAEIAASLPADARIVYDGGHTTFWSNDFTPVSAPRSRLNEVAMTQLGFGLPYALALCVANPGAPVLNITGDGAFGFTLAELDTARRYELPVISILHNNGSWGVIKFARQRGQGFTLGDDLEGTDYAAIARGFGCHGEIVTTRAQFQPALERALASGLPAVLDCRVRFEPHPGLPAFGRMSSAGLPASGH